MEQDIISKKDIQFSKEAKPIKFIDEIEENKHIILFYEEPEYAKILQFRFINNGLEKGECGFYLVKNGSDGKLIEEEMKDSGINVEKYKKQGILHFFVLPHLNSYHSNRIELVQQTLRKISAQCNKPIRLTGIINRVFDTEEKIKSAIEIEEYLKENLRNFDVTLMCPYYVEKIESKKRGLWIKKLTHYHDSAIFAPSLDQGIAFDL